MSCAEQGGFGRLAMDLGVGCGGEVGPSWSICSSVGEAEDGVLKQQPEGAVSAAGREGLIVVIHVQVGLIGDVSA